MHKTQVPAMLARQNLDDGTGFAVRLGREDNAFIRPMHLSRVPS